MNSHRNRKKITILAVSIILVLCLSIVGWWLIHTNENLKTTKEFDGMKIDQIRIINDENQILELEVKIADEPDEQAAGFQYIAREIIEKTVILFVFPLENNGKFHMQNVEASLDIAFIKTNGTIIDILRMDPNPIQLYGTSESFKYVIEARAGFFQDMKISAGKSKLIVESVPST